MSNEELYFTVAGATKVSGTLINSISKLITTLLDLGRVIGTSLRSVIDGRKC